MCMTICIPKCPYIKSISSFKLFPNYLNFTNTYNCPKHTGLKFVYGKIYFLKKVKYIFFAKNIYKQYEIKHKLI